MRERGSGPGGLAAGPSDKGERDADPRGEAAVLPRGELAVPDEEDAEGGQCEEEVAELDGNPRSVESGEGDG